MHFREAVQGGGRQAAVRGCWDALRCGFVKAGPPVRPLEEKVCPQVGSDTRPSPGAGSQRSCPDIWLLSSGSWHSPPGPGSVWPGAATLAASCHHSSLRSSDRSRHRAISLDQASVILFCFPPVTHFPLGEEHSWGRGGGNCIFRHASDFPGLQWCREVPVILGAGRQREDRGEGLGTPPPWARCAGRTTVSSPKPES